MTVLANAAVSHYVPKFIEIALSLIFNMTFFCSGKSQSQVV